MTGQQAWINENHPTFEDHTDVELEQSVGPDDEADDLYHRAVDAAVTENVTVDEIFAQRRSGRII
jgi:hypothetical protein